MRWSIASPTAWEPPSARRCYRHTGGHALFTAELLESLREGGGLVQDGEGRWVEGPKLDWARLPARVEAVIEERIGRLSAEEQELLAVASVEGEEFHAEVLARVQGLEEGAVIRQLSGALSTRHRLVGATALEAWQGKQATRATASGIICSSTTCTSGWMRRSGRTCTGRWGWRWRRSMAPYPGTGSMAEFLDWLVEPGDVLRRLVEQSAACRLRPQLARHFGAAGMTMKALGYLG